VKPQKKGFYPQLSNCHQLRQIATRLMSFIDNYSSFFNVYRHNVSKHARSYLGGLLMKLPRKNMERICEVIDEDSSYADYQHFISDSKWDYTVLRNQLAQETNKILGGPESVLCIDESGFTKKGKKSVGVSRQYNGRLGKVDNCQVGVFASLCNGDNRASIVDYRIFLPDEWINDEERCLQAGIPKEHIEKKSKLDHAKDMVEHACEQELDFEWIAADAFYGRDLTFHQFLAERGKKYTLDVPQSFRVYTNAPKPYLPRRKSKTGRKYTRRKTKEKSISVEKIAASIKEEQWKIVEARSTTKGMLRLKVCRMKVYAWESGSENVLPCDLLLTVESKSGEKNFFITNAKESISTKVIIQKHACRFWIERSFQDGKTSAGMADYQVRGWLGWHHHMAMVMMALLFMLKERELNKRNLELLSCQDITEIISYYLPRKDKTEEQIFQNMLNRHKQRQDSIISAKKNDDVDDFKLPK